MPNNGIYFQVFTRHCELFVTESICELDWKKKTKKKWLSSCCLAFYRFPTRFEGVFVCVYCSCMYWCVRPPRWMRGLCFVNLILLSHNLAVFRQNNNEMIHKTISSIDLNLVVVARWFHQSNLFINSFHSHLIIIIIIISTRTERQHFNFNLLTVALCHLVGCKLKIFIIQNVYFIRHMHKAIDCSLFGQKSIK